VTTPTRAVVIGGSAGGFQAFRAILEQLPGRLPFPLVLVLHQLPSRESLMPRLVAHASRLHVSTCLDKEQLVADTIYIAPPGYHLLIEREGTLALSGHAPENYSRPSIDVLFESAADAYREGLVAILLSGANLDGVRGLGAVHARHGRIVVQDPESAEAQRMPRAGLAAVKPEAVLAPEAIGRFIAGLAGGPAGAA
jgi:two-component system chemotaxis response regulator CheB